MEKIVKPISGLIGLLMIVVTLAASVYFFTRMDQGAVLEIAAAALLAGTSFFLMKGLIIVQPNHSRVLNLFGTYTGTVKENGWYFVNPFYATQNLSLRAQNLESSKLKVNDKLGNPIEIAAVVVWQVGDTYK